VDFCHKHNLVNPETADTKKCFGIRVTLPPKDTFARLLGDEWELHHWYASEIERDTAFEHMSKRHGYYRGTDNPTQVLEKIVR